MNDPIEKIGSQEMPKALISGVAQVSHPVPYDCHIILSMPELLALDSKLPQNCKFKRCTLSPMR